MPHGMLRRSRLSPSAKASTAATTCQKSFTSAGMPRMSSMTPDHDQEGRPGQDRRGTVRPQDADRVQVVRRHRREGERHGEGDGDRHAAEPRHRELVDLALGVRLVEQAVPDGEEAHERGDRQAHD